MTLFASRVLAVRARLAPAALSSLVVVGWLGACTPATPKTTSEASVSPATKSAPAQMASHGEGPCQELSKSICEGLGNDDESCNRTQSIIHLLPPQSCIAALEDPQYMSNQLAQLQGSCTTLVERLCNDLGSEAATCKMVREQTPNFSPSRCDLLLQDYPTVLAELRQEEIKNGPLSPELQEKLAAPNAPSFGPSDAKVVIVEFSDFQCPFCSQAANVISELKTSHADKVRFVFRQFPLSFHSNAHGAAQASLAAHAQGKFWEYHDLLFAHQDRLGSEDLAQYAKQAGLDMKEFKRDMSDKTYGAQVDSDIELGTLAAVNGTPTMFINGTRVSDPTNLQGIVQQVEALLTP